MPNTGKGNKGSKHASRLDSLGKVKTELKFGGSENEDTVAVLDRVSAEANETGCDNNAALIAECAALEKEGALGNETASDVQSDMEVDVLSESACAYASGSPSSNSPNLKSPKPGSSRKARKFSPFKSPSKAKSTIAELIEQGADLEGKKTIYTSKPVLARICKISTLEINPVEFAIADETGSIKAIWFMGPKYSKERMRELLVVDAGIYVTGHKLGKRVISIGSTAEVNRIRAPHVKPSDVLAAKALVQVHANDSTAVIEIKKRGHRTGVTYAVTGEIVGEDAPTEVQTRTGLSWVKRFYLQDKTGKISVSLWRNLSQNPLVCTGNFITVTALSTGTFNNNVVLGSTGGTQIIEQEIPVEEVTGEVLCVHRIEKPWVFLLLAPEDGEDIITVRIKEQLLYFSLNISEDDIYQCFPCYAIIKKKGSEITGFEVESDQYFEN